MVRPNKTTELECNGGGRGVSLGLLGKEGAFGKGAEV